MDIGSIFLILGLLIFVALFIGRPLFERSAPPVTQQEHVYSHLLAERDRILNALQELDFDFALGKIPELEYPPQRNALLQSGAEVLRELDQYQSSQASVDAEARLEAVIAARRADAARQPAGVSAFPVDGNGAARRIAAVDDDLETLIANRRRERSEKAAGFCPKCGRPVQKSDRFCPRCGVTLN